MLIDPYKRPVNYLRVSVTDRCDFRCQYCMAENMKFLPKKDLLTLDELERICISFIDLGTKKIRITGGEPLVRKNVMSLFKNLGSYIKKNQLSELTLTTNGSQLEKYAEELYEYGVRRINVSVDTLKPNLFRELTRRGDLDKVLKGIEKAIKVGLKIKINTVALKETNEFELLDIMTWAHSNNCDITFIETMPLGEIDIDKMSDLLHEYTIFVLPSHGEGLPKSALEAAASGMPLILSSASGCKECIFENKNGLLIEIMNEDNLKDAMEWMLLNKKKIWEMSNASRNLIESKFSLEKIFLEYKNIIIN